jgi:predicted nucleic acid-binding Zn ribbon protein
MPRRIFEFLCENGHRTEAFVDTECHATPCKECDAEAQRVVSAPSMKLEGWSGSFPTAADSWVRKRTEKIAQERKQNS